MSKIHTFLLFLFYASIPIAFYREPLSLLLNGYSLDIAFGNYDEADHQMISARFEAYIQSTTIITFIARLSSLIWLTTFIYLSFSIIKTRIQLPYYINEVSLSLSTLLVALLLFLLLAKVPSGVVL